MTTLQKPSLPVWKVDSIHPVSSVHFCNPLVSCHLRSKIQVSTYMCLAGQTHAQTPPAIASTKANVVSEPAVASPTARVEPPPPSDPGDEPDAGGPGEFLNYLCTKQQQTGLQVSSSWLDEMGHLGICRRHRACYSST